MGTPPDYKEKNLKPTANWFMKLNTPPSICVKYSLQFLRNYRSIAMQQDMASWLDAATDEEKLQICDQLVDSRFKQRCTSSLKHMALQSLLYA